MAVECIILFKILTFQARSNIKDKGGGVRCVCGGGEVLLGHSLIILISKNLQFDPYHHPPTPQLGTKEHWCKNYTNFKIQIKKFQVILWNHVKLFRAWMMGNYKCDSK